jgi:myo-inositol-1(or 4)-monophosphatase
MDTTAKIKEVLLRAIRSAGQIQRDNFQSTVNYKVKESISSIVTDVDISCDKTIMEIISGALPAHNILTEEHGLINHNSEYTWVVDPLDGTSNFAAGIPWFGVLIAVFRGNTPIMGGAYLPMEDLLYFAEEGKGAFVNSEKLAIPESKLKNSLVAFGIDYTENAEYLEFGLNCYHWLIKNTRNIRSTNSLVDWTLLTEGKLGATVNLFTKIWDIAAPWIIIKEAGGELKHLTEAELIFDLSENGLSKNYPVMAGNPKTLMQLFKE